MELFRFEGWAGWGSAAATLVVAALVLLRVLQGLAGRVGHRAPMLGAVLARVHRPARLLLPMALLQLLWETAPDTLAGLAGVRHVNSLLLIAAGTWLAMAMVGGVADGVIARHPADLEDNLRARRVQTQTRVLARIAMALLLLAGTAFMLMTFPRARQFGTSLLASAGLASVVIGIAAKSVFSNLLAGLHIALAQPIRIDDVLIVEGEWGRVEEITSTYVVIKLWDERRQIVPLVWFSEHPFQNWTRRSADLLGTVFLWVDYALPLEPLRREAERVCKASALWDGRVCLLQVTETNERAMQLRVLVSSRNSGMNFDLRCEVREALVAFIAREYPQALPRLRFADEPASRDGGGRAVAAPPLNPGAAPARPREPAAAPGR